MSKSRRVWYNKIENTKELSAAAQTIIQCLISLYYSKMGVNESRTKTSAQPLRFEF